MKNGELRRDAKLHKMEGRTAHLPLLLLLLLLVIQVVLLYMLNDHTIYAVSKPFLYTNTPICQPSLTWFIARPASTHHGDTFCSRSCHEKSFWK